MKQLEKALNRVEFASKVLFYVGGIALIILFLIIFCDIFSRFVFNLPITGTDIVAGYLMVAVGFLALGYGELCGSHVKITFVGEMVYKERKKYTDIFILVIVIVFFVVMTWQIGLRAYADWAAKVLITNTNVPLPVWWQSFIAAVGSAMLVVSLIVELIRKILKLDKVPDKSIVINSEERGA